MSLQNDPLLRAAPDQDGRKLLDPVLVEKKIGTGGMGTVYRGHHRNLGLDVAVKVLHPSLVVQEGGFLERFRREANLAAAINHPSLVRVFDVREQDGLHYLIQELVDGGTVLERIRKHGPLGLSEAVEILLGAARGLAAAHAAGIVHRDIKPENLMLDAGRRVKVTDLGLAKATGSSGLTATQFAIGTPRYMSPEQWEDSASVGPRSDVWALGATLYYLLTGEHALGDGTPTQIVRRVALQPFPDIREARKDVPPELAAVLERCVARDPAERFADAGELVGALEHLKAHWVEQAQGGEGDDNATLMLGWKARPGAAPAPTPAGATPPRPAAPAAPATAGGTMLIDRPKKSSKAPWLVVLGLVVAVGGWAGYHYVTEHTGDGSHAGGHDKIEKDVLAARDAAQQARVKAQTVLATLDRKRRELRDQKGAAWLAVVSDIERDTGGRAEAAHKMFASGDAAFQNEAYESAKGSFDTVDTNAQSVIAILDGAGLRVLLLERQTAAKTKRDLVHGWFQTQGVEDGGELKEADAAFDGAARLRDATKAAERYADSIGLYDAALAAAKRRLAERKAAEIKGQAERARRRAVDYYKQHDLVAGADMKRAHKSFDAGRFEESIGHYDAAVVAGQKLAGPRAEALAARDEAERFYRETRLRPPSSMNLGRRALLRRNYAEAKNWFVAALKEGNALLDGQTQALRVKEKVVRLAREYRLPLPSATVAGDRAYTASDFAGALRYYKDACATVERSVKEVKAARGEAEAALKALNAFFAKNSRWAKPPVLGGPRLDKARTAAEFRRLARQYKDTLATVNRTYNAMLACSRQQKAAMDWHTKNKYMMGGPHFHNGMTVARKGLTAINAYKYPDATKLYDQARREFAQMIPYTQRLVAEIKKRNQYKDIAKKELQRVYDYLQKTKKRAPREYSEGVKLFNSITIPMMSTPEQAKKHAEQYQKAAKLAKAAQ
ncbi:MAG: serine/threonine protein kinase, partial [Planctomycetota bacterium]|nr:serine/threonine protein kinase [Planctomycetota bacterium]